LEGADAESVPSKTDREQIMRVRAIHTLVVGMGEHVLPGKECELENNEAERCIKLGSAAAVEVETKPKKHADSEKAK
jgi:hypothetical protein